MEIDVNTFSPYLAAVVFFYSRIGLRKFQKNGIYPQQLLFQF